MDETAGSPARLELGLDDLLQRMTSGSLGLAGARQAVAAYAATYAQPTSDDPNELDDWLERRRRLLEALRRGLMRFSLDSSPVRALDVGTLLHEAAALHSVDADRFISRLVGSHLLRLNRPGFAIDFLDERGAGLESAEDVEWQCLRLRCLADHRPAQRFGEETEALVDAARRFDLRNELIAALVLLAEFLEEGGDPQRALAVLEEAIQVRRQPASGTEASAVPYPKEADLWGQRGLLARNCGRYDEAIRSFEQARQLAQIEGGNRQAAFMLSEIGITWQHAGDMEHAAGVLSSAAAEARRLGDSRSATRWTGKLLERLPEEDLRSADLVAMAMNCLAADPPDVEAALHCCCEAIERSRQEGLPTVEVQARSALALAHSKQGSLFQARMSLEAALLLARQIGLDDIEVMVRLNLGMVLVDLTYVDEAQAQLEAAIELGERLRSRTTSSELRKAMGARLVYGYELLLQLRGGGWTRGKRSQPSDPAAALELSQQAQAVNLAGWLALQEVPESAMPPAPELGSAVRRLIAAEVQVERSALGGRSLAAAFALRNDAEARLAEALAAAGQTSPAQYGGIVDLPSLRASLGDDETFVDLFSADSMVMFNVITPDSEAHFDRCLWTRAERLDWLERWETALAVARQRLGGEALRGWRFAPDPLSGARAVESDEAETGLAALLDTLVDRLLAPIVDLTGGADAARHVFIAPHRELYNLPFWAFEDLRPDWRLSVVPTANCLRTLRRRRRPTDGTALKIGDCTDSLPFVAAELGALARYEAVPPRLAELLVAAPSASWLHFSGHGLFDGLNAYDSGLVVDHRLSGDLDPDLFIEERRFLTPARRLTVAGVIAHLDLPRCHLVTLSACCTGLPHQHPASEFTSLPAAFLVAGARNVVASIWPAHDGATALLMQHLDQLLSVGEGPAEALFRSRRWLKDLPRGEVVERLASDRYLPPGEHPFASPIFTMAFQAYGVD